MAKFQSNRMPPLTVACKDPTLLNVKRAKVRAKQGGVWANHKRKGVHRSPDCDSFNNHAIAQPRTPLHLFVIDRSTATHLQPITHHQTTKFTVLPSTQQLNSASSLNCDIAHPNRYIFLLIQLLNCYIASTAILPSFTHLSLNCEVFCPPIGPFSPSATNDAQHQTITIEY